MVFVGGGLIITMTNNNNTNTATTTTCAPDNTVFEFGVAGYYGGIEFGEYIGGGRYDLLNFVVMWWCSKRRYDIFLSLF